jgi:hypothetical protein
MLTKLIIRNFKRFEEVEIELGNPVVFIGPNNSGKTSALQALALWEVGLKKWIEKRKGKPNPEKRPGVAINRKDLIAVPVPVANLLWRNLHVREISKVSGHQKTQNVRIDIAVEGVTEGECWKCGFEFDYANEESFYCRPLKEGENRLPVPEKAEKTIVAFLPPMSGLAAYETRLERGAVNVRIGEGRTAEVLRNLCYSIAQEDTDKSKWNTLKRRMYDLFRVELEEPQYIQERSEIVASYKEKGCRFDLSSSGRGMQQVLLILAYLYQNPGAVLLLDEPDAHLEILRQRQIYTVLTDVAAENGSQIIAASHSEVLLNEAAGRDLVIAFLGKPRRIDDRGSQLLKSLKEIDFEDYYLAEQTGWVLYVEGSTDLAVLRAFAEKLGHEEALKALERPFVKYIQQPSGVRSHFQGLKYAVPHLKAIAIFDRQEKELPADLGAVGHMTKKKEIENYFCFPETLYAYAQSTGERDAAGDLFAQGEAQKRRQIMEQCIQKISDSLKTLKRPGPWDADIKASDDFLTPLFENFFEKLNLPNLMRKKNFYELVRFVPKEKVDPEIKEILDAIARVKSSAVGSWEE